MTWYDEPTSAIWQLILAALIAISTYRGVTRGMRSPNQAPAETRYKESGAVVFMVTLFPKIITIYVTAAVALHAVRAVYSYYDPVALSAVCAHPPPMWLTLAGILGSLMQWAGSELRVYCYKVLGQYFTFHLAVQENQPLIQTGPYAYVRHPSYLAAILQGAGLELSHILGNPFSMCLGRAAFKYSDQIETAFLVVMCVAPILAITRRMGEEEKMMKAKYGKEYAEWEKRTWRMIPYVY